MPDDLLTTVEAARELRVSRATITRWARLGIIRAARLPSGVLRIPRSEIDRILSELREEK